MYTKQIPFRNLAGNSEIPMCRRQLFRNAYLIRQNIFISRILGLSPCLNLLILQTIIVPENYTRFIHLHLRHCDRIILQLNVRKLVVTRPLSTIPLVACNDNLLRFNDHLTFVLKNSCFISGYCLSAFYFLTWHLHLNSVNITLKKKCILMPQLLFSTNTNSNHEVRFYVLYQNMHKVIYSIILFILYQLSQN